MYGIHSEVQRRVMPLRLRSSVYLLFGGVWLSGCVWLVLHSFFEASNAFGAVQHPWESTLLKIHGGLSIALAYLFGWVMARHASEGWRQRRRRISGGLFTCIIAILSVSGFMLFFVADDVWQSTIGRVHEVLGLLVTLSAIEHWRVMNRRTTAANSPDPSSNTR